MKGKIKSQSLDSEPKGSVGTNQQRINVGSAGSGKKGAVGRFQKRSSGRSSSLDSKASKTVAEDVRPGSSAIVRSSAQRKGSIRVNSAKSSGRTRGSIHRLPSKLARRSILSGLAKTVTQKEATTTQDKEDRDATDNDGSIQELDPSIMIQNILALVNSSEDEPSAAASDSTFLDKLQGQLQDVYKSLSNLPKKPISIKDEG